MSRIWPSSSASTGESRSNCVIVRYPKFVRTSFLALSERAYILPPAQVKSRHGCLDKMGGNTFQGGSWRASGRRPVAHQSDSIYVISLLRQIMGEPNSHRLRQQRSLDCCWIHAAKSAVQRKRVDGPHLFFDLTDGGPTEITRRTNLER